jgi:tetratricopeptide (TPR) repeat protein
VNRWLKLTLLAWLAVGCKAQVTRIVDGQVVTGHSVPAMAYATYLEARLRETSGDFEGAKCGYRSVLKQDPQATEAMVHLGALSCGADRAGADELFETANARSPSSTTLWSTRAKCAIDAHRYQEALGYAEKAWALSPTLVETNRQLLITLIALGQKERAEHLARGLLDLLPGDPRVSTMLTEDGIAISASQSVAWPLVADRFLGSNRPSLASLTSTRLSPVEQKHLTLVLQGRLFQALVAGDAPTARKLARSLGLSTIQLGQQALDAGNSQLALEYLLMAHELAPERVDLWVLTLLAADREGDESTFTRLLREVPHSSSALDEQSRRHLASIIARRVDSNAAALVEPPETTEPRSVSPQAR